jgi:serine/threonine protein kinase
VLSVDKCDESLVEDFRREIEAMSKVNHPNVCLYMGACTAVPGKMMIVTALYQSSLDKVLFSGAVLSLPLRVRMAKEIALGMNWLHSMTPRMIHSDLKTSNILLDENGRCVVSDFGQTQVMHRDAKDLVSWGGTPLYMAPEKLQGLAHNEKVDVYSFGLVLWELVHRQRAFDQYAKANNLAAFVGAVCERKERPAIRDCPPSVAALIEACWHTQQELRPTFQRVVEALDDILVEVSIPDPVGRRLWTDNWKTEPSVAWKSFKPLFSVLVGRQSMFWVKPLLVTQEKRSSMLEGGGSAPLVVTMEQFGNVLAYFGPLTDFTQRSAAVSTQINIVDKIQATLSSEWFHGELDSSEAAKLLRADGRLGAFMLRFSGREPGTFTLSRTVGTKDNKEINHQRIPNATPGGLTYSGQTFVSLPDLVNKLGKHLGLKHALPGSRYAKLVERWADKTKKKSGFKPDGGEGIYSMQDTAPSASHSVQRKESKLTGRFVI